jgi:hypothetical protein
MTAGNLRTALRGQDLSLAGRSIFSFSVFEGATQNIGQISFERVISKEELFASKESYKDNPAESEFGP